MGENEKRTRMMTLDETIKYCEEVVEEQEKLCKVNDSFNFSQPKWKKCGEEHRQLAEWLKELKESRMALNKIKAEIKEWYWQADKQALAKDPCVVDAMVDLFIRTIKKYEKGK